MEQKKIRVTYQSGEARDMEKYPYGVDYMLALVPVEMSDRKVEVYLGADYEEHLGSFPAKDDVIELYAEMGPCHEDHEYHEGMYFEQLVATVKYLAAEAGIDPGVINFGEMAEG